MGSVASIDLFYKTQEQRRFDEARFDKDDIKALLLEREQLCIGGHRTSLGNAVDATSQEIYEFCIALMRGEMPDMELLREQLNDQLNTTSDDFVTEIEV